MGMVKQGIKSEMDEMSSKPMKFDDVMFKQVDRTLKALTEGEGDFLTGVEGLEMALAYYYQIDKKFNKELKKINDQANKMADKERNPDGSIDRAKVDSISFTRAKLKFAAIMRLMGRTGLLPEQRAKFQEPS